ncbi:MAG: hypothetical protein WAM82_12650 [Thermoanaerobaculia bacterium]
MNKPRYFQSNHAAILAFLLVVFAAAIFSAPALAICCSNNGSGECKDGTHAACCATGSCNVFCCNCDGTCRTGPCMASPDAVASAATIDRFNSIDLDKSGGISLKEFEVWANHAGRYFESSEDLKKAFEKLDSNKNGIIDPGEFDKSLANYKRKAN